jgi:hypothetical protein
MMDSREQWRCVQAIAAVGLVLALLGIGGCGSALSRARKHVYAPTFNYITDEQLESSMWQLAAGVHDLDRILAADAPLSKGQRLDVIRVLERMLAATQGLGPEGWPSNHPRITQHLGRFQTQLTAARRAVEVEPPSYYLAGTISGACLACH